MTTAPLPPTPLMRREIMAVVMCNQRIRRNLKVPASASFFEEKVIGITGKPANYHIVTGIVESQNAFGVYLRSNYRCDLHYIPADRDSWYIDYWGFE